MGVGVYGCRDGAFVSVFHAGELMRGSGSVAALALVIDVNRDRCCERWCFQFFVFFHLQHLKVGLKRLV